MKYGIYKRKSGRFQVYFSFEGGQVHLQRLPWGKTLENRADVALLIAYLKRFGYHPEKWGKIDKPFNFDRAVQTWVSSSSTSEEWKQHKRQIVDKFFRPYFKKQDIRKISSAQVQEIYASLLEKKYSPHYCQNILSVLHSLLVFFKKSIPVLPDFPKIQIQEGVIRWLTAEEQDKIFQHIPDIDKPIFGFMRCYGTRCNEAGGLLKKNVFLDKERFVIATTLRKNGTVKEETKTRKIRSLPIIPSTRWIFERDSDSPFVFSKGKVGPYTNTRLNLIWNRACQKAGIKINLYNGVRHSFGCQRLNEGYSIEEIRVVLGHSTSKMTQRYAQLTTKSLENIIEGRPVIKKDEPKLLEHKGINKKGRGVSPRPF